MEQSITAKLDAADFKLESVPVDSLAINIDTSTWSFKGQEVTCFVCGKKFYSGYGMAIGQINDTDEAKQENARSYGKYKETTKMYICYECFVDAFMLKKRIQEQSHLGLSASDLMTAFEALMFAARFRGELHTTPEALVAIAQRIANELTKIGVSVKSG